MDEEEAIETALRVISYAQRQLGLILLTNEQAAIDLLREKYG